MDVQASGALGGGQYDEGGRKQTNNPSLGWFEKFIYFWIVAAGLGGLLLGKVFPQVADKIESVSWQGVSLPLVIAMFFVMFPPMARIRLDELKKAAGNVRPTIVTLVANWLIAPPLMWLLARIFVPEPEYRAGLILLGLAPCTAMVLFGYWIWGGFGDGCWPAFRDSLDGHSGQDALSRLSTL